MHYMRVYNLERGLPVGKPHGHRLTLEERLFNKRLIDAGSECWLWTGMLTYKGYGTISIGADMDLVHRASYRLFVGHLLGSELVLHRCDVRNCFNPAHLFKGTNDDNMKDMVSKGRQCFGTNHPRTKLSKEQIEEIRTSKTSNKTLAELYGVARPTICNIKNNKYPRR